MASATTPAASLTVDVMDVTGEKVDTLDLPEAWFGGEVNVPLVHQVVTAQRANARTGSAQTKTRTTARGGGRKPWRQKGTGRARHGSIRSPMWIGGAVAHGRSADENHSQRVNKKMKRGALRSALADLAANADVTVVRRLRFDEPRTKQAVTALEALGHSEVRRLLVVLADNDGSTVKSFRNLPAVTVLSVDQLNTYDVVRSDVVVFDEAAIALIGTGRRAEASDTESRSAASDTESRSAASDTESRSAASDTESRSAASDTAEGGPAQDAGERQVPDDLEEAAVDEAATDDQASDDEPEDDE